MLEFEMHFINENKEELVKIINGKDIKEIKQNYNDYLKSKGLNFETNHYYAYNVTKY